MPDECEFHECKEALIWRLSEKVKPIFINQQWGLQSFNDNCRKCRQQGCGGPCPLSISWDPGLWALSLKGELVSVLFGRRGTAPQNELVSLAGCSACNNIPNRENSGQWRPGSGPWCSDRPWCLEKSLASQLTELPCLAGHGFSRARPSTWCLSFYIPAFFLKSTLLLSFPISNSPPRG